MLGVSEAILAGNSPYVYDSLIVLDTRGGGQFTSEYSR